jgi:hypothetical protein
MLNRIFKLLTLFILPFLAIGFSISLWQVLTQTAWQIEKLGIFAAGFAAFTLFWLIFRKQLQFFFTLEHELTHLLMGLLFFKKPRSLTVSEHAGGAVELYGSNFLISLAPYFLPTVSLFLIPLGFVVTPTAEKVLLGVLGASVAFHVFSTFAELHWGQTDLQKTGWIFSFLFLPVAILIFYGSILAFVGGGLGKFGMFWLNGFYESWHSTETIFKILTKLS